MNPFFKMSKSSFATTVLAFLVATLNFVLCSGCYEGSQHSGNSNSGSPEGKPGPSAKPFGLVILDVIRPSDEALNDANCGNIPASLVEIRKNEIDARIDSVKTLLETSATVVKVYTTSILPADCQAFRAVATRARTAIADGYDVDSVIDKPALHIRLVIWYGDSSPSQPGRDVTNSVWADGARLSNLGFDKVYSLNHFALSARASGYVWRWQRSSRELNNFAASVVVDPLPTQEGLDQIATAVQNSTIAFGRWLNVRTASDP